MKFPPKKISSNLNLMGLFLYRISISCKSCVAIAEAYDIYVLQNTVDRSIFEYFVDDA